MMWRNKILGYTFGGSASRFVGAKGGLCEECVKVRPHDYMGLQQETLWWTLVPGQHLENASQRQLALNPGTLMECRRNPATAQLGEQPWSKVCRNQDYLS
jgi:hypothetical protein